MRPRTVVAEPRISHVLSPSRIMSIHGVLMNSPSCATLAAQDALDQYPRYVAANLSGVLYSQPGAVPARQKLAEITKAARDEVEQTLRTAIRDDVVVGQLTTAVVRFG